VLSSGGRSVQRNVDPTHQSSYHVALIGVIKILNIKIIKYIKLKTINLQNIILTVLKLLTRSLPGTAVVYSCMDHAYTHPYRSYVRILSWRSACSVTCRLVMYTSPPDRIFLLYFILHIVERDVYMYTWIVKQKLIAELCWLCRRFLRVCVNCRFERVEKSGLTNPNPCDMFSVLAPIIQNLYFENRGIYYLTDKWNCFHPYSALQIYFFSEQYVFSKAM
jgi:hypothetical protein